MKKIKLLTRKIVGFVKRNIYSLAIAFCVVVGVSMVVTTVVVTNNGSNSNNNQQIIVEENIPFGAEGIVEEPSIPVENPEQIVVPISSDTVIVFDSPIEKYTLGMEFAKDKLLYSTTLKQWQTHLGVDLIASENTEVKCVYDGVVEKVENNILEGMCVTIKHSNTLKTVYKSLAKTLEVKEGSVVKKGDVIGYTSTSAIIEQSEGAHLHFELIENNEYVDPMKYFSFGVK